MIRKFLNISLAFLLLLSTSGVVVVKHYCGSTFVKHSINVLPENCCGKTCKHCHNETKLVKVNDDFVSANTSISFSKDVNPITLFTFAFSVFNLNNFGLNLSNTLLTLLPHYARNMPSGDAVVLFSVFRL